MKHKYNFSAGPAAMPLAVLRKAEQQLVDYSGYGLSLLELSHRGAVYSEVHHRCIALLVELLHVPESHQVLLLAGGATLQFSMVPLNLLHGEHRKAGIVISGAWSQKAFSDLKLIARSVEVVYDGTESQFCTLPDSIAIAEDVNYLHICSNETIHGVQWQALPNLSCPIVADMSSDILTRPLDWSKLAVVYAGSQKNLGPAGLCVVIVRKDLCLEQRELPAYLNYKLHMQHNSLYNTPPGFAVYMVMLQLEWALAQGGVNYFQQRSHQKAKKMYDFIDASDGFYQNNVDPKFRSTMNVPFSLETSSLESDFLTLAKETGFEGLKGHKSLGGMRASLYNAVSMEDVDALLEMMRVFQVNKT